jgi:hypothetical protein
MGSLLFGYLCAMQDQFGMKDIPEAAMLSADAASWTLTVDNHYVAFAQGVQAAYHSEGLPA